MARTVQRRVASRLNAPFLKSLRLKEEKISPDIGFPFTIPALAAEPLDLVFTRPVTIFVGNNGSGKSTLLEAIAGICGFGRYGGTRNYHGANEGDDLLSSALRAAWLPKVTSGFYTRAETLMGFIAQIDEIAAEDPRHYGGYGGRSLTTRSHGEGYLELFRSKLSGRGVFILDEPEAALSPAHQIALLQMIRAAESGGEAQFIIATHSPLLMAYPGATLLHLTDHGIIERPFEATDHYRVLREFYLDPHAFMSGIFNE